jgi:hypothetical protein
MTDAVLANIMKKLEGNIDDLDGLETLKFHCTSISTNYGSDEDQKYVRETLERGSSMPLSLLN